MVSYLHIPGYPLNQFIDSLFYYTGFTPANTFDRFLPDGEVHMIIDLTETPKHIYHNETLEEIQSCRRSWFSGFRTMPITIPAGHNSEMLIIQFRKGHAAPFVAGPVHQYTNEVVDGDTAMSFDVARVREAVGAACTPALKCLAAEEAITGLCAGRLSENAFVQHAVSAIVSCPHQVSIHELSRQTGYTQKHMIKIFKDHVGVTPKEFQRIIRFQKTIAEIEENQIVNWAALAHDSGYYDQSHLIANFKHFSGFTPVEYLTLKGQFPNYVPVG